jgi:hypothetical protein
MNPGPVTDLKAFVPAKDIELSKAFYADLGFTINWSNADIDSWWEHVQRQEIPGKYPGIICKPPTMQPRGIRVLYVSDPTGVLWYITDARADTGGLQRTT